MNNFLNLPNIKINSIWLMGFLGELGTPCGVGKIKTPEKFDNVFFGIHRKMADSLDALTRLSLERSVEAIVDAGKAYSYNS